MEKTASLRAGKHWDRQADGGVVDRFHDKLCIDTKSQRLRAETRIAENAELSPDKTTHIGANLVPEADGGVRKGAEEVGGRDFTPRERGNSFYARGGKRTLDLLLVVLASPIWLPLLLTLALLILIVEGRPVFFKSPRIGADGSEFPMLKFRSMNLNADSELAALLGEDAALKELFLSTYKLQGDPRVSLVGRALRRWSLDELPQLLNLLSGDMSLVGPRPLLPSEINEYYADRVDVALQTRYDNGRLRPGLTGAWQVAGRSLLPYEQRIALDVEYAVRCSLYTDVAILCRTIPTVVWGHGAF